MARRKLIFVVGVAALSLVASAPRASAQQPAAQPSPQAEQQEQQSQQAGAANQFELMRSLNLTPEQRTQIAQIRQETEAQARQINQRLRRAHRALEEAIYANADESVVEARTRDVADAEAARVKMRADAELKLRRVLTTEQLATFREMRRQAQMRQRQQNGTDMGEPRNTGQQPPPRPQQTPAQRNGNNAVRPPLTPRQQRQIERGRRLPPRP